MGPGSARTLMVLAGLFLVSTGVGAYGLLVREHPFVITVMLVQGAVYAAAAFWIGMRGRAIEGRQSLSIILGAAILARATLIPMPPVSTDVFRYIWDGRVQANGINPYRHVPADPALAGLRDPDIHPYINRAATAVTIYPPMAQIAFLAATRFGESVAVMKSAMVAFEGLTVFALLGLLAARGLPRSWVLIYAWHPLPLFEFAGSGHVDAVAIGFMMVAMLAADRRRPFLAGMLLAAGAAAKYLPAVVAPALYRRGDWRMPAGFGLALVLLYAPYLGAGPGVLGFLPGYAQEEGVGGAGIFWLALAMRLTTVPGWVAPAYLAAVGIALVVSGLGVALRHRPDLVSCDAALRLLAAVLVAATPHYAWYFIWLVPLLCIRPSLSLGWLTLAAPLLYGIVWPYDRLGCELLLYGPFVLIVLVEAFRSDALLKEIGHGRRIGHQSAR